VTPTVRPLPLNVGDDREGVDARWELRQPDATDPMGYSLTYVMHVTPTKRERFPQQPYFVCSRCERGFDTRQFDDSEQVCPDVRAVREWQAGQ
jgi:hypothetical protein